MIYDIVAIQHKEVKIMKRESNLAHSKKSDTGYKPVKAVAKRAAFKTALAGSVKKNREALKELATH